MAIETIAGCGEFLEKSSGHSGDSEGGGATGCSVLTRNGSLGILMLGSGFGAGVGSGSGLGIGSGSGLGIGSGVGAGAVTGTSMVWRSPSGVTDSGGLLGGSGAG